MQKRSVPLHKKERPAAHREYQMMDSGTGKEFRELAQLASEICHVPVSLVVIIDEEKKWFKTAADLPEREFAGYITLCSHAADHPSGSLVIPDLHKDKRFSDDPVIMGEPHIVFFAAVPLTNANGNSLGTLCVFDNKPKTLTENQMSSLTILARQAVRILELQKSNSHLETLKENLSLRYEELQQFTNTVSHDIKSPLSSIVLTSEMLRENFGEKIDEENDQLLNVLNRSSSKIRSLVDGMQAYYRAELALNEEAETFQLTVFLDSVVEMLKVGHAADIVYPHDETTVIMNKAVLEQIIVNLLLYALRYNDKDKPVIHIQFSEDDENYNFIIKDNGKGKSPEEQEKIFELFMSPGYHDRHGMKGFGTGLLTVKKLVEKMSGKITAKSTPDMETVFSFFIKKRSSH
jgi:signal transduction histidine kinase